MDRREALLALALAGCATTGGEPVAAARRTFVLVHGAWHGGWCWRDVRAILEGTGGRVFTPTLTGLGERAHVRPPDLGLETHIADVCAVIEAEELADVVLVGHSYGGMVVTGVADRLRGRLRHVVYLDAALPRDGQSMITQRPDLDADSARAAAEELSALAPDGWLPPFPPAVFGVPEADAAATAWLKRRLTPHPLRTWVDPVRLASGGGEGLARTYIVCTRPALPRSGFAAHAAALRGAAGWRVHDLATGHDAMVTAPAETAALILEAAA